MNATFKRCVEKPVKTLGSPILGPVSTAGTSVQICSARYAGRWLVDRQETNGMIPDKEELNIGSGLLVLSARQVRGSWGMSSSGLDQDVRWSEIASWPFRAINRYILQAAV